MSNQEAYQMQTTSKGSNTTVDEYGIHSFPAKDKIVDENRDVKSSDTTRRSHNQVLGSPKQSVAPENQVKAKAKAEELGRTAQTGNLESAAQINETCIDKGPEKKHSIFEAAAAEAELDMLLDSFSETNKFDSLGFEEKFNNSFPVLEQKPCTSVTPPHISRKVVAAANLIDDDALDDLLEEVKPTSQGIKSSSSSHSGQTSKVVLDDFDSWLDTI